MKTFANPSAVLPSDDGLGARASIRRTTGTPQHRFVDAVAQIRLKAQTRSDKTTVCAAPVNTKPGCEQSPPDARKRSGRSLLDNGQVAIGPGSSDQATSQPVGARKTGAKPDFPLSSSPNDKGQRKEESGQKGFPSSRSAGYASYPILAGPTGWGLHTQQVGLGDSCRGAAHALPQKNPSGSKGGPSDHTTHGADGAGPARLDKAGVGVPKPVPADTCHQTLQKRQGGDGGDKARIAETESLNMGQEGRPVAAKQSVENGQHTQTGEGVPAKSAGFHVPFAVQPVPKVHSPITPQTPDQTRREVSRAGQDAVAETPRGPHIKGQPHVSLKHDGTPIDPRFHAEVLSLRKDTGGPHLSPVSIPGEAVGAAHATSVAGHLSLEAPALGMTDPMTTRSPIQSMGEQILDSLQTFGMQGDRQVVIRLQPPELGIVVARFQEQGGHLDGTLEIEKSDTRRQIEQALPDVVRSLQDAGIPVRRFDVTGGDSSGQDLGRGLPQQDTWSEQQGSGQNRDHFPAAQTHRSHEARDSRADLQETLGATHRINTSPARIDVLL